MTTHYCLHANAAANGPSEHRLQEVGWLIFRFASLFSTVSFLTASWLIVCHSLILHLGLVNASKLQMGGAFGRATSEVARRPQWAQKFGAEVAAESASTGQPTEMTPEVLEVFHEFAKNMRKTQVENTMPVENSPEVAETKERFSKLRRVEENLPAGRLTEAQLVEWLNWRTSKPEPPVADLASLLQPAHSDAISVARALLLNYGTPQIVEDKSGSRAGYWVATSASTGIPIGAFEDIASKSEIKR